MQEEVSTNTKTGPAKLVCDLVCEYFSVSLIRLLVVGISEIEYPSPTIQARPDVKDHKVSIIGFLLLSPFTYL